MLAVLQGYVCATRLLLGDAAEGKLALLQDLADGDEVRRDLRNREREGRYSWMRCWPFYIRAFPGGGEKVCVSSEQGGMMTGMPQRLCQLHWTSSVLGHHRRAQTWGCKPPCQMLKRGPTAKPGRPSWHTVQAILQGQLCRQGSVGAVPLGHAWRWCSEGSAQGERKGKT